MGVSKVQDFGNFELSPMISYHYHFTACSSIGAGELESLAEFISAEIPADCSSIHLCMKDTTLLRNIHFYVIFDTCNFEIIIGIEELKYTIPFKKMNWGMSCFISSPEPLGHGELL